MQGGQGCRDAGRAGMRGGQGCREGREGGESKNGLQSGLYNKVIGANMTYALL